jgi:hypothetical protein
MSQAHIEQFYGIASKDQALVAKMLANTKNPDDFVANAVKEGGAMGYTFTAAEASAWIEQQKKIKASSAGIRRRRQDGQKYLYECGQLDYRRRE